MADSQGMEFRKQMVVLVTGAFAFTAALFWNTAIKDSINHFLPASTGWTWEIVVAIIVTVIAVVATYFLSKSVPKETK